jgi:uncharacterized membrane protein
MAFLVTLFGLIIAAVGVVGMMRPAQLFAGMLNWPAAVLLAVAVAVRLMLGIVFILAAPSCRFPRVMYALGIVALLAALVVLLLGPDGVRSLVQWCSRQPSLAVRAMYAATVLFGAFLVYSSAGTAPR